MALTIQTAYVVVKNKVFTELFAAMKSQVLPHRFHKRMLSVSTSVKAAV